MTDFVVVVLLLNVDQSIKTSATQTNRSTKIKIHTKIHGNLIYQIIDKHKKNICIRK